ncbi:E3 ubiquitin-protein ligase ZNRF1, partial [Daubentonia madagascariensis]
WGASRARRPAPGAPSRGSPPMTAPCLRREGRPTLGTTGLAAGPWGCAAARSAPWQVWAWTPARPGGCPLASTPPPPRGTGDSERAPSGGGSTSDSTYAHGNGYQETGGGHHRDGMLYLGSRASLADALPLHIAPRWFSSHSDDVLTKDAGECVICLEELLQGDTIARLPCLCIYHKSCIDSWFEVNRSCPEHPAD